MEPLAASIPTAATGSASTPLAHAFIRALLLGTSPNGYISLCTAIVEAPIPRYSSIKVPLLVIAGSEDKSAPIDKAAYIVDQYGSQKKELRVLEGVGHWHVIEAYSQVQDMICDFLMAL
jgi:esterase/lipase